jgi:acyl carrier protein
MNSDTAADVRRIIAKQFGVKLDRVVDDVSLRHLGGNRLDRLELLIRIEDQVPNLQVGDLVVDHIETVGDLMRSIEDLAARPKRSTVVE